jgi:hypothetical protein
MSWTVACFCGHLFCGPTSRCPRCGTPVPVGIARPDPDQGPASSSSSSASVDAAAV